MICYFTQYYNVLDNLLWVTSRWTDWSLSSASCQLSVLLFLNERHNKMPTIIRGKESVLEKCPWETLWYKVRNDDVCFIAIYEESISMLGTQSVSLKVALWLLLYQNVPSQRWRIENWLAIFVLSTIIICVIIAFNLILCEWTWHCTATMCCCCCARW